MSSISDRFELVQHARETLSIKFARAGVRGLLLSRLTRRFPTYSRTWAAP